jgi:hypothetical protein
VSLAHLFVAFGKTPVGLFMRDSTWAFAATEAVHLLGLAALGGAVVLLGLSASGLALTRQPLAVTAQGLFPVFLASLLLMLTTGVLLVGSKPYRYFLSDPFRAKLVLLAFGVAIYLALHKAAISGAGIRPAFFKAASLGLGISWLGVGLAGRLIGLF